MFPDFPHAADFNFAQRCLDLDEAALTYLKDNFAGPILAYLMNAGASSAEAEETVGSLWADCFTPLGDGRPRFARYDGRAALQTWLNTVAFNLLLTKKRADTRRERHFAPEEPNADNGEEGATTEPAAADVRAEAPLLNLMRDAVEFAFTTCPPEDFVMLQLEHCDQLERDDLARMFGCSKPTVSRLLHRARGEIEKRTLDYLRQRDPWLELKWDDFVELCRTATPGCFGLTD